MKVSEFLIDIYIIFFYIFPKNKIDAMKLWIDTIRQFKFIVPKSEVEC